MENDRECPICCQENQKILSKIRQPDKLLTQARLLYQAQNRWTAALMIVWFLYK